MERGQESRGIRLARIEGDPLHVWSRGGGIPPGQHHRRDPPIKECQGVREGELPVNDDADRLRALDMPDGERRIINQGGAGADHDCRLFTPPLMSEATGGFAADPLR